jgi:hypothetical protein
MESTSLMRIENSPYPKHPYTSKASRDTTAAACAPEEGDLILRLIHDKKGMHKLSPPWEGPFAINRMLGNDVYYLPDVQKDNDGNPLTREVERPWNVNLLRRFYT